MTSRCWPAPCAVNVTTGARLVLGAALLAVLGCARVAPRPAAPSEPAPTRMIPNHCATIVAARLAPLRGALPPQLIAILDKAGRPYLDTLGLDPASVQAFAACVVDADRSASRGRATTAPPTSPAGNAGVAPRQRGVLVVDAALDAAKVQQALTGKALANDTVASTTYHGVALRQSASSEYAILAGHRLVFASPGLAQGAIDRFQGRTTTSAADGAAWPLLERVGCHHGSFEMQQAYFWMSLTADQRKRLEATLPGTGGLVELAGSIAVGPWGADPEWAARARTPDDARRAAQAMRGLLGRLGADPAFAASGLSWLLARLTVRAEQDQVLLTVVKPHGPGISRAELFRFAPQLADLVASVASWLPATAQQGGGGWLQPTLP